MSSEPASSRPAQPPYGFHGGAAATRRAAVAAVLQGDAPPDLSHDQAAVPKPRAKSKFELLELGRGIAAALVVLHHSGNMFAQPRFFATDAFGGHLRNFNVGVDFFFVLSGFIIAWIHWDDIGRRDRLRRFVTRRLTRIYPSYWCILFPLILLYQLFPNAGVPSQHDITNVVASILLVPHVTPPVLGVAWTLVHEVAFYALFAAIIIGGRAALWALPAWAVAILLAQLAPALPFPVDFVLSPFNLEFLMGVGGALLLRHGRVPYPMLIAVLGAAIFLVALWFGQNVQDVPLVGRLVFGGAALLAVIGSVEYERSRAVRFPAWLSLFGAASYAIYLVHPEALSVTAHVLSRMFSGGLVDIVVILAALLAIATGIAFHRLIEVSVLRRARQVLEPAPAIHVELK